MAEVDVGRRRVDAELDPQRPAAREPSLELAGRQHVHRPEGQVGDRFGALEAGFPHRRNARLTRRPGAPGGAGGSHGPTAPTHAVIALDGATRSGRHDARRRNPGLISSMSSSKDTNGDDRIEPDATADGRRRAGRFRERRHRAEPAGAGQGGRPRARPGTEAQARGAPKAERAERGPELGERLGSLRAGEGWRRAGPTPSRSRD